jgi:D-alanyl-D-alanine carboxypeptidase
VTAKCWAVFDGNKMNFVHGKREYMRREVASLTKMMTLYTVLKLAKEYRINMTTEKVTI